MGEYNFPEELPTTRIWGQQLISKHQVGPCTVYLQTSVARGKLDTIVLANRCCATEC